MLHLPSVAATAASHRPMDAGVAVVDSDTVATVFGAPGPQLGQPSMEQALVKLAVAVPKPAHDEKRGFDDEHVTYWP